MSERSITAIMAAFQAAEAGPIPAARTVYGILAKYIRELVILRDKLWSPVRFRYPAF